MTGLQVAADLVTLRSYGEQTVLVLDVPDLRGRGGKTSLSVCPVSKRYMRGGIGFETKGKVVINVVLFQIW